MPGPRATTQQLRYSAWVIAAVGAGLAGYVGYVLYPRFDMPAGAGAGLLVLAVAAGTASFFSPCSFPLLVSMLARPLAADRPAGRPHPPIGRAIAYAGALSLGAVGFLAIVGALLALGAGSVFADITFTSTTGRLLRVAVGVALVVFGLVQTNRLHVDLRRFEPGLHSALRRQAALRRRRPLAGFVLFGFVYVLAGFGWTGPILAGLASQALTTGGAGAAAVAISTAGAAIVVLMFVLAVALATARERVVESMSEGAPVVKRWGGRILVAVGSWLVALGVFADFFARLFPV